MGNALLGERVRSGERAAFAEMYEAYANRIFGFCVVLLRDRDEAADVMHDTFVLAAQRIGQLRDADRLEAWLFAIARHRCYRRLQQQGRVTLVEEPPEASAFDDRDDMTAQLTAADAAALVWEAASGLNERDRAVLYLNTNEGLEGSELVAALGERHANPYSLLHRAKQQLERAVAVLLVARFGRRDCAALAEMLDAWDGSLTPLLRKRLARHVDQCDTCRQTRARTLRFAAFAMIPLVRPQRLEAMPRSMSLDDLHDIAARGTLSNERWQRDGFPPLESPPRRRRVLVLSAAALVLLFALATYEVAGGASAPPHGKPATLVVPTTAARAYAARGQIRPTSTTISGMTATLLPTPTTRPRAAPVVTPVVTTVPAPAPTTPPVTVKKTPPTTVHHTPPTTVPKKPGPTTTTSFNF